jgi:5'-deoxynucleotidase YfbR-like HD superfamily hydrolase
MNSIDPTLSELQKLSIDLALIDRHMRLAGTERHENDIEHSLTVALLCWYIHDKHKIDLDIAKILKYAISHDFVERYAGDTNTFASEQARQDKVVREAASLKRLSDELEEFPDLIASMSGYEDKRDDEALFVWTVDKMQQLVMSDLNNWRAFAELSISYDRFTSKWGELVEKSSPYAKEIFAGLVEYSKTQYESRLKADEQQGITS